MRMKTNFLNSIISILIIAMTIIGITPGMVSALDEQLGNDVGSDNGNSSLESTSLGSSGDVSSSTGSSSTDISSDVSSDPDKTTSENSDSDKATSGTSDSNKATDKSSNSDKTTSESLDSNKAAGGPSDPGKATSGSPDPDKASGGSNLEKATGGTSDSDKTSRSSDTEKVSSESSDPQKASSGSSSTDSSSTDKSIDESSSTDKSSSESSNTVHPCIASYSGIFIPTVLVSGSSSTESSGIESSSTCKVTSSSTYKTCSVNSNSYKACSVSSSIDKESPDKTSIVRSSVVSSSIVESIGNGNYNSSSNSSGIDSNDTNNKSHIYYIYYTNVGIYIISSDGSYVFYPSSSGLEAVRDLYWMGDAISEPEENICAKELVTRNLISGYPNRFDFAENATCITHIEFEPLMTFKKTTTIAEVLMNKSVFIPETPAGKVYQYTNIFVGTKGAGSSTFLKSGLVEFKVEKTWIKDNNVNESHITLQRYNGSWVPLHTEKVGEDNSCVYYKSETPGFYFFAITEE